MSTMSSLVCMVVVVSESALVPGPKIDTGDGVIRTNSAQAKNCTSNSRGHEWVCGGFFPDFSSRALSWTDREHDILAAWRARADSGSGVEYFA